MPTYNRLPIGGLFRLAEDDNIIYIKMTQWQARELLLKREEDGGCHFFKGQPIRHMFDPLIFVEKVVLTPHVHAAETVVVS